MLVSGDSEGEGYDTQLLYFTCSSLSKDDERIYLISDRDGHPNVWVHDMFRGTDRMLSDNKKGILKSYVYFDGTYNSGLGKASVSLDYANERIYYIQDDRIMRTDKEGNIAESSTIRAYVSESGHSSIRHSVQLCYIPFLISPHDTVILNIVYTLICVIQ